jgi:hypothetical protein
MPSDLTLVDAATDIYTPRRGARHHLMPSSDDDHQLRRRSEGMYKGKFDPEDDLPERRWTISRTVVFAGLFALALGGGLLWWLLSCGTTGSNGAVTNTPEVL